MDLKALFNDDDAVSPVIGVILMVAITVILAAVIASFVLGLGQQTSQPPQASFGFDYDSGNSIVTVSHEGGNGIEAQNLVFRGDVANPGNGEDVTAEDQTWEQTLSPSSKVNAGKTIDVGVTGDDYEISVVYENPDSDSSSTLASDSGPDS